MYRQGDVLLVPCGLPSDAKKAKVDGRIVLATGEATGHAHTVAEADAELYELGEERFLSTEKAVAVEHQEHATVEVPAGTYKVIRQREYSPQEIRNVRD